ncbi:MAG TPA: hypothetical protein PLQ00_08065 [Thermoguttaceae bacterium]|mgnify:FL=1|nr:hypothetical protein [Thermoguttaceae bacterium]
MKNGWFLIVLATILVGVTAGWVFAQQPAGPLPNPPTPGGRLPEKGQPVPPGQATGPSAPAPGVQPPGGIPTLPLPGTLPGAPTPGGSAASKPGNLPAGILPGPAGGVSGLPAGGLPDAPMPSYPGAATSRAQLPSVGGPSMPSPAMFADPIYGPYVPQAAPIGPTPTFGTIQPSSPTAAYEKPFSDYTPPPVYSPYMNLYRFNPRGPIDNYYSLVRPFVMQNAVNQQYSRRLQDLQMNNRLQQTILQRLQQQNQIQQGTYQPGYFMNHGSFFPGY